MWRDPKGRLHTSAVKGVVQFFFFFIVTLSLYWGTMNDSPRSDHVIIFARFTELQIKWATLREILFVEYFGHFRFQPLAFILHYVQIKIFQFDFWKYHGVNVVLHALNAFLVLNLGLRAKQGWWASFAAAMLFLTAFTNIDLIGWPFHFYVVLQTTLTLLAVALLLRSESHPWALPSVYGLSLVQIYLYEPGLVVPFFLFVAHALLLPASHQKGKRLRTSFFLLVAVYVMYFSTVFAFIVTEPSSQTVAGSQLVGRLIALRALLAITGSVLLILDTSLLHNLFAEPKLIIDELVFFAPASGAADMLVITAKQSLIVAAAGAVIAVAVAVVAISPHRNSQITGAKLGLVRKWILGISPFMSLAGISHRLVLDFLAGSEFTMWHVAPAIWLPLGIGACFCVFFPASAVVLMNRIGAYLLSWVDPRMVVTVIILGPVLLGFASRAAVNVSPEYGTNLGLSPWDVTTIGLFLAVLLLGRFPRGQGVFWALYVLFVTCAYISVISLGRPTSYLISQSRYTYWTTLALAVVAVQFFAPAWRSTSMGSAVGGPLSSARTLLIITGLGGFVLLNGAKVISGIDAIESTRAPTNDVIATTRRFLDTRADEEDRLFIAASTYPAHEHLALGSDILPLIIFGNDKRVTQNLRDATHILANSHAPVPVPDALRRRSSGAFIVRFGFWLEAAAGWSEIPIFVPLEGCSEHGWYIDFVFEERQPVLKDDEYGLGHIVFGRCAAGGKQPVFESAPLILRTQQMNLFHFGRTQGTYFVIFERELIQRVEGSDFEEDDLVFQLGPLYRMTLRKPFYFGHTFVGINYLPFDVLNVPIGYEFPSISYRRYGLREYARGLVW